MEIDEKAIKNDITTLKSAWGRRNTKMKEWYKALKLTDTLYTKNMESYTDNHPRTFFNAAHYLLTMGEISHDIPIASDAAMELDKKAKVNRACQYMWRKVDERRLIGGSPSFVHSVGFDMLVLGWYAAVFTFNDQTGLLDTALWSPADTYPRYEDNKLTAVVFEYKMGEDALEKKAQEYGWNWKKQSTIGGSGKATVQNYFSLEDFEEGSFANMVLINDKPVTGVELRDNIRILVAPVGGFPDRGSIDPSSQVDWTQLIGQSIFESNMLVNLAGNKWMSFLMQILRDTAQAKYQEFSGTPQANPEQVRKRGAVFHYAPGEAGLQPVPQNPIPLELSNILTLLDKEKQKGSFSDVVFGMAEKGMPGYVLSQLATTSANQVLFPYMASKHFLISEGDKFWLKKLKESHKTFEVKGRVIEELTADEIPEDADVQVNSDVATPKDWLERATIANMTEKHLDSDTILTEIFKMSDTQSIKRRRIVDDMRAHPMTKNIELITAYETHAQYLQSRGDYRGANRFMMAAKALESQFVAPATTAPGQPNPTQTNRVLAEREAGAPERVERVNPTVSPPEGQRGFSPAQIRNLIGVGGQ